MLAPTAVIVVVVGTNVVEAPEPIFPFSALDGAKIDVDPTPKVPPKPGEPIKFQALLTILYLLRTVFDTS
jgi:hypothetical protein